MEALTDAIGLRMPGLGAAVVDILDREVQLIFVVLALASVFRAAIGEHAQQRDVLFLEERQHAVIEHVGSDESVLAVVELGGSHLGIRVQGGLVDPAHALDRAHVIGMVMPAVFASGLVRCGTLWCERGGSNSHGLSAARS